MSTPTIPAQRAQVVPCETCGTPLANLLATCRNDTCFAADVDSLIAEQRNREAGDD
jgi:hypothetical protein